MLSYKRPSWSFWLVLALIAVLIAVNYLVLNGLLDIRHAVAPTAATTAEDRQLQVSDGSGLVRIGVVSRFAPNIIYRLYQPIMDYLNTNGEYRYELVLSDSYPDAARRLSEGEVEGSFLGAWMCNRLPQGSGLEPVLVPVNAEGQMWFHAALVTAEGSDIENISDLAGRRVAVPSAQAFSGNWLQQSGLARARLTVAELDTLLHFRYHETVVWEVLRKEFDAGVVKQSLARRYQSRGLRTVALSPGFPGPPLVVRRERGEAVEELVRLLLALDPRDPDDRQLMQAWTPEFAFGFTPVDWASFQAGFEQPSTPGEAGR